MPIRKLALLTLLAAASPLSSQNYIEPGQTVTGTLAEGDLRMDGDGEYYDSYRLRGQAGALVMVRMSSPDFDTHLRWGDETGEGWEEVAANDDGGDGTNSRLLVRLSGGGGYELRASAFDVGQTGAYTLTLSPVDPPTPVPVRLEQVIDDAKLGEGDYESENGFTDYYLIRAPVGTLGTIRAESEEFDVYLEWGHWRDGQLIVEEEDDDSGGGRNADIEAEFEAEVDYGIAVRAYDRRGTGRYNLILVQGELAVGGGSNGVMPRDDDWPATDSVANHSELPATAAPRITALETVQGTLGDDNPRDQNDGFYEEFTYQARAGEQLRIRLSADDFDPYLQLGSGTGAEFVRIIEDDDGGPDLDAELSWTAPRAGEYTIRVTSALADETGPYVLRIQSDC